MYAMQDKPDFIINFYTLLHNFAGHFPHINEGFLI